MSRIAVAPLPDGRLELWAPTAAGGLFTTWKLTTDFDADWGRRRDFLAEAGALPDAVTDIAVAPLPDGRLELWAATAAGGLFTTWKLTTDPDADWAEWTDFLAEVGALPDAVTDIAVAPLPNGRFELWAATAAGGLFTTWKLKTDPDADWAGWTDFLAEVGPLPAAVTDIAVGPLPDGRLELWAATAAGGFFTTWKLTTDPDADWAGWTDFLAEVGPLPAAVTNIAVAPLRDGRLELWAATAAGGLFTTWKLRTNPNADWAAWTDFLSEMGALPAAVTDIAVAPLRDGRLELWAATAAGGLFTTWKLTTDPDADWAAWTDFLAGYYLVGASAREITPSDDLISAGRIFLWGSYDSRNSYSTGVRDPIWSRSLAIRDKGERWVALVSLDVCALAPAFTENVRSRLAASRGVPPEAIAINVTHTHSAPVTIVTPASKPGFDQPDLEYLAFLENAVVASIEQAIDSAQPAILEFGRGSTNIGINRHPGNNGAYDRTLDVIRARDEYGNCIAVAFFHGCHPTSLDGPTISSDYPGIARDVIEEAVGGVAIFFQGYGGTIEHNAASDVNGRTLGNDVLTVLNGPMDELEGPIEARTTTVDIPLQPLDPAAPGRARTMATADPNRDLEYLRRWANFIESQGNGAPGSLPVEIQGIHIGVSPNDWRLAACSHEVVAEFAGPVRAIWPYERLSLMAYSNGQMSYLPTSAILADPPCTFPCHENYEGGMSFLWYAHRAPVVPKVDDLIIGGNIELFDPGWELIGDAQEVVGMTALHAKLFAATSDNKLWWRKAVGEDIPWHDMGTAEDVVGMAALNGMLFAASADGKLWQRIPYGLNLPWTHIGHAQEVVGMTALNGKLFCATRIGQLWWRDPVDYDVPWQLIGHAQQVVGMTAAGGKLICSTAGNELWWREPVGTDAPWHRFGTAQDVVGMAALNDKLFAATQEGQLWWRDL